MSLPFYKVPKKTLKHNTDWTMGDLEALAVDAEPVTGYKPIGDRAMYDTAYTHWSDPDQPDVRHPARDCYRVAWRAMAANTGERTLISALIPPGAAHVHTVGSFGKPDDVRQIVVTAGVLSTLLADFAVRAVPTSAITADTINRLPMPDLDHPLMPKLILRTLRLNCLTDAYADLWAQCWDPVFLYDEPVLPQFDPGAIGSTWTPATPLRRAADRRNALVEIDALVALMLGAPTRRPTARPSTSTSWPGATPASRTSGTAGGTRCGSSSRSDRRPRMPWADPRRLGFGIRPESRPEELMRLSARNQIRGIIVEVTKGATTSHVQIDIGGSMITASITNEAVEELGLAVGQEAYAVVKASDVMVAVD